LKLSLLPHTAPQCGFSDRDTRSGGEIGLRSVVNDPAGLLKEQIDLLPSHSSGA
jgi:hypothetical protein